MTDRSQEVGHRRFRRLPVAMPVVGRALPFGETEAHGMVRNIGGGGLMAELPVQIVPRSVVALILQTRQGSLAVTGQVAWTGPPSTQVPHGIAFRESRGDDFTLALGQQEQG